MCVLALFEGLLQSVCENQLAIQTCHPEGGHHCEHLQRETFRDDDVFRGTSTVDHKTIVL